MTEFKDLPGMTPDVLEQLSKFRVASMRDLVEADLELLFVDMQGVSLGKLRTLQAYARTELLAGVSKTPKPFIAIQNLAIESIVPAFAVPSGARVDLWWKTDAELAGMLERGEIMRDEGSLHLLVNVTWLPPAVKNFLSSGGIVTMEQLAADATADFMEKAEPASVWVQHVSGVTEAQASAWRLRAQSEIAPNKPNSEGVIHATDVN